MVAALKLGVAAARSQVMAGAQSNGTGNGFGPAAAYVRPWLKPWYKVSLNGDQCALHYGGSVAVLEGKAVARLLPALLPLLDGRHSQEQILAELGEPLAPAVENAIAVLDDYELLTEGPPPDPAAPDPVGEAQNFLAATSFGAMAPADVAEALAISRVAVIGAGRLAAQVSALLLGSGVSRLSQLSLDSYDDLEDGTFAIVVPAPSETPKVGKWNEVALETGTTWMQVAPFDGAFAAIGPLFVPGETCCFECYRRRRADNVDFAAEFWKLDQTPGSYPAAPSLAAAIAGLASTFALRWLVEKDFFLPGRFYALEAQGDWKLSPHTVHRVPRCPACSGAAGIAQPLPWHSADVSS
jgi:bacteriocin biosynthesis cyclodehydratase domain-containing protein